MTPRQIGKFKVSHSLLSENLDLICALFKKMDLVVIRAESRWDVPCIEYVGVSPLFEEQPEGVETPEYDIIINQPLIRPDGRMDVISKVTVTKVEPLPRPLTRLIEVGIGE